ncbi:MAG: cysteine hydrolase [Oscillospiraceae bacterium]|nr:cysteine hydrolase [Oscillospiraceae bacterium]
MRKLLIVVDMQKDFTYGALRNEDAIAIIKKVRQKIEDFDGEVVFTLDTHGDDYMQTQEGKKLPVPHCIKGSEGHGLVDELKPVAENALVIEKETFGSVKLGEILKEMNTKEPLDEITLIGVCTDICVISNAMIVKAALPEVTVKVDSACCAGVTPESHQTALEAMRACQIEID